MSEPAKDVISIYTLSHPTTGEIRYVGKTKHSIFFRLSQHIRKAKNKPKTKNDYWIISLFKNGLSPIIELIDTCDNQWQQEESFYIIYFKWLGFRLNNLCDGGEGLNNPSKETRLKLSILNKNGIIGTKGVKQSLEVIENRTKKLRGQKRTNEQRTSFSKSHKAYAKKLYQFDLNNQLIKVWDSIKECCRFLRVGSCNIINVCKGKIRLDSSICRSAHGFYWSYTPIPPFELNSHPIYNRAKAK